MTRLRHAAKYDDWRQDDKVPAWSKCPQLFLVFADDSHYEFYSHGHLSGARCVDRGGLEHVRRATREAKALTEVCSDGA